MIQMNKSLPIMIWLIAVILYSPSFSQETEEVGGHYIGQTFESEFSEQPQMAWLVPPNIVIAGKKFSSIHVYSASEIVQQARYLKVVGEEGIAGIRKKHHVACEMFPQYYLYELPRRSVSGPARVFYSSKAFSEQQRGGIRKIELSKTTLDSSLAPQKAEKRRFLHKYFSVRGGGDGKHFYSFHGFYDPRTKEIFKKGLILHASDGTTVAQMFWSIDPDSLCDGCGLATYNDKLEVEFSLINVFSIPRFAFPVLLIDTSTIEGRAISFATFDERGSYSEYRAYEYVVGCGQ